MLSRSVGRKDKRAVKAAAKRRQRLHDDVQKLFSVESGVLDAPNRTRILYIITTAETEEEAVRPIVESGLPCFPHPCLPSKHRRTLGCPVTRAAVKGALYSEAGRQGSRP